MYVYSVLKTSRPAQVMPCRMESLAFGVGAGLGFGGSG